MKIGPISSFNNINNEQTNKVDKSLKTSNSVSVPIMNNTLSEAIGRSQVVSFSGTNRMNSQVFEHSCSELLGDKEQIKYNKEDGSFIHTIVGRDGLLKKQEEFYPQLNTEIITRVKDGITTITKKTPSMTQIEKLDENDEQIYYEESTSNSKKTITTDFEKGRRVIVKEYDGRRLVQVIDLKTNTSVSSGDLVLQRKYDKNTDTYNTVNLITGQVLKQEKFRANRKLEFAVDYSPVTGKPVREEVYDEKTGGYRITEYYESGAKKSLCKKSRDERREENIEYARDGKTITSHLISEYGRHGELECETEYYPNTTFIKEQSIFSGDNCTRYIFRKEPNRAQIAEHYIDGRLAEKVSFNNDGKTYRFSTQYKEDGSYRENFFDRYGARERSKSYTADNFLYQEARYNEETDEVIYSIDYNRHTGETTETHYNEETGFAKQTITKTASGKYKEVKDYYNNGRLKAKREFKADGSFYYTTYDETGAASRREEYNADGTKKQRYSHYDYEKDNSYYRTERTQSTQRSSTTYTEDELIKRIDSLTSNKLSDGRFEISKNEWEAFAKILGLDSAEEVMSMDKNTYRKLTKKYHPDIQPKDASEESKAKSERLFKIINNLYSLQLAQG